MGHGQRDLRWNESGLVHRRCAGLRLPAHETEVTFNSANVFSEGRNHYSNVVETLLSVPEPRVRFAVQNYYLNWRDEL